MRPRMRESKHYNSRGGSRPWRRLRERVLREEPVCQLRYEGCTGLSTTVDHTIPKAVWPDGVMVRENCHGACRHCNLVKGKKMRMHRTHKPAQALKFFE